MSACLGFRELGLQPYEPVLEAMRRFTEQRNPDSQDEVWLVEHPAVFTQGQAGKAEHLLVPGENMLCLRFSEALPEQEGAKAAAVSRIQLP